MTPLAQQLHGKGAIWKIGPETARIHALESEGKGTRMQRGFDGVVSMVERGRPSRTVIVDVYYWNQGETEVVEGTLGDGKVSGNRWVGEGARKDPRT